MKFYPEQYLPEPAEGIGYQRELKRRLTEIFRDLSASFSDVVTTGVSYFNRLRGKANEEYNLDGGFRASTYRVDGVLTGHVPVDRSNTVFHIQPEAPIALDLGASFIGYGFGWTIGPDSGPSSASYGVIGNIDLYGPGAAKAVYGRITQKPGATGVAIGILGSVTSVPTASNVYGINAQVGGECPADSAYLRFDSASAIIEPIGAGFGILIESSATFRFDAFRWNQNQYDGGANFLTILDDDASTVHYQVQGDGRTVPHINERYDTGGSPLATTFYCANAFTVPASKTNAVIHVDPNPALGASAAAAGYVANVVVSASEAGSAAYGASLATTVAGAATAVGLLGQAAQSSGATGGALGLQTAVTSVATGSFATCIKSEMLGTLGGLNCFFTTEGSAHFGTLHISNFAVAVTRWNQTATPETADYEQILASDGSTVRYQVDYTGKPVRAQNLPLTGTGYPLIVSESYAADLFGALAGTQYTVPPDKPGRYRVSMWSTITTEASPATSTILGGLTGFIVNYTYLGLSCATRTIAASQGQANVSTIGHSASDSRVVYCDGGTDISYSYGYAPGGGPPYMGYDFAICIEYLG